MHDFTEHLLDAIARGTTLPFTAATPPRTAEEAEAIQRELIAALGGVGAWKVSPWTETAVMSGAPIPQAWRFASGETGPDLAAAKLEVEFALVRQPDGSFWIAPALELVRSRLEPGADWPATAKQADLLSGAGLVVGTAVPLPAEAKSTRDLVLVSGDARHTATTTLSLPALLRAAAWVETQAERLGLPLPPGTAILTGARIGPTPPTGTFARGEIAGIGAVEIGRR